MATYTSTLTPRLRMVRTSPGNYDRSGHTASTSEPGPSRLPEFSQLIDVNLNDMAMSDTTDQATRSRVSTPFTVTRGEATPAEKLRALLHVLPPESTNTVRAPSPSQQYLSERDSDYDITEPANVTKSIAQESVRNIFSNARRDPDTPQTLKSRRNSADTSDIDPTPRFVKDRTLNKGKQKSLSDNDMDQWSQASNLSKTATRSKVPVTMQFLRERFSDSIVSPEDAGLPDSSTHRAGNQTFLRDPDSSMPSPPMATSTPQQSLRMSVNSQFHSNLLESDTEMQHAIDGLDEYDDITNCRSISPPPTIRKGSNSLLKKRSSSHLRQQSDSGNDLHRTPSQSNARSKYARDEQNEVDEVEMSLKSDLDWDRSRYEREQPQYDHANEQEELDEVKDSLKTDHEWDKSRSRGEWQGYGGQADDQEEIDEVEISLKTDIEWDKSRSRHERSYGRTDSHQRQSATLSSMELTAPLGEPAVVAHSVRTGRSRDVDVDEDSRRNDIYGESHEWSNSRHSRQHLGLSSQTRSHTRSVTMSLDEPSVESKHEQNRNWDSPHSWNRSKSDRQSSLRPRPLSPVHSRGLDGFEMSLQSTDENYNSYGRRPSITSRNLKNTPGESTRPPSRTSSLQTTENTYMKEDPSLRRPSRSSSPLPSGSNKRSTSPTTSPVLRNQRPLSTTPLSSNLYATPSAPIDVMDTPSRFLSTPSGNNPFHDSSSKLTSTQRSEQNRRSTSTQRKAESLGEQKRRMQSPETDGVFDLRDTDFSSRGGTPDLSDEHGRNSEFVSWSSAKQTPSRVSTPSTMPRNIIQNTTQRPSPKSPASLSTPSRRSSSRDSRREFETPSPPKTLPDLPTPSSSDESDRNASRNHAKTSRAEKAPRDSTWLRTPRPPSAWAQTPKSSRHPASDSGSDNHSPKLLARKGMPQDSGDTGPPYPQTPMNRTDRTTANVLDTIGKTPRPPGSWLSTPAPVASASAETREQKIELLTPITSLSKGTSFDPQTPGVPGGWLATPAIRKSILKVRFDENQVDELSSQPKDFDSTIKSEYDTKLPSSPSSPRKSKGPNIRVVDAFGREHDSIESEGVERNQSKLRIVDAMGRSMEQADVSQPEDAAIELKYSSRGELLKRIRRGLDDLAEDFDDQVQYDAESDADGARIEELNNMSKQARKAREQLQSRSVRSEVALAQLSKPLSTASWRTSRRFWCTMVLINLIVVVFIFRISEYRAKQRYLNSYFDPFNPELYLYVSKSDHSLYLLDDDLSRTSWASYARTLFVGGRNSLYDWMRVTREIQLYLWNMWTNDSTESPTPRNGSTWLPS